MAGLEKLLDPEDGKNRLHALCMGRLNGCARVCVKISGSNEVRFDLAR